MFKKIKRYLVFLCVFAFATTNITELDVKRLVMGYYMDENDVYKRPLSKMVQDVARQLHIDI